MSVSSFAALVSHSNIFSFLGVHCDSSNMRCEKLRIHWQVKKIDLTGLQSKNPHH